MDFKRYDSRTASEIPQRFHLRNPANGELIYDGEEIDGVFVPDETKPCIVLVVGSHSRSVQAGILEDARAKLNVAKGKKKKEEKANAMADVQKSLIEGAARVIRGFENIERDGKPLTTSPTDVTWFLDLNFLSVKSLMVTGEDAEDDDTWRGDSFAQQILKASNDAGAYLGEK